MPATHLAQSHPHLHNFVQFFEALSPSSLEDINRIYAPTARFKDPFNDVQGPAAVQPIFEHMYATVHDPRFVVVQAIQQGADAFVTWDFHFRFQRFSPHVTQTIHGATHLQFDEHGRVTLHRDYWDAAEELYEKLPAVGSFMRWVKRRAGQA
jgi:steroid Delta-isomerase